MRVFPEQTVSPLTLTLSRQGRGDGVAGGEGTGLTWSVASGDLSMELICGESTESVLNTGKPKR